SGSSRAFASLPSVRSQESATAFVLQTLGSLWMIGIPIEWSKFHSGAQRYRVALPSYPFERQRYWATPVQEISHPTKDSENKPEAPMPEQPISVSTRSTRRDAILTRLHSIVYKLIGIETSEKDIQVSFFDLGVDSLLIIQFTQAIQDECGL